MLLDVILQQEVLEIILVVGLIIVVLGLFWRIIMIGFLMLFSVYVLANHQSPIPVAIKPKEQIVKTEIVKIQTPPPIVDSKRSEYVSDCVSYGFEKSWCEDNWDDKK
jgi:hypothetical protein